MDRVVIGASLPRDLVEQADRVAAALDITRSQLVRRAVRELIGQQRVSERIGECQQ